MERKEALEKLESFRQKYLSNVKLSNFSALVAGLPGSGKTTFVSTGRPPVLIDSFDPLNTLVLADKIKSGEVTVRPFWGKPLEAFKDWIQIRKEDLKTGLLSQVGTYSIDSLTTFMDGLVAFYCAKMGRENNLPQIQDYPVIYQEIRNIIKESASQGCDFILTAHLLPVQDEATGRMMSEIDTFKKLRSRIPVLFTEKYVIITKPTPKGTSRVLLTQPKGIFLASTQLGRGGRFLPEEEPNIKVLLKKAGFKID